MIKILLTLIITLSLTVFLALFTIGSLKARAFYNITGKEVAWHDAVFVVLTVSDAPKSGNKNQSAK